MKVPAANENWSFILIIQFYILVFYFVRLLLRLCILNGFCFCTPKLLRKHKNYFPYRFYAERLFFTVATVYRRNFGELSAIGEIIAAYPESHNTHKCTMREECRIHRVKLGCTKYPPVSRELQLLSSTSW